MPDQTEITAHARISREEAGRRHTEWQKHPNAFFGPPPPCYFFDAPCLGGCEYGMINLVCAREAVTNDR